MIKQIVLTALGFSIGVSLVSGWYHLRHTNPLHVKVAYVMARWGYAVAFGLLLEALTHAPVVQGTWRTWVFVVACVCVGLGFAGVAIEDHKNKTVRGRYL